MDTKLRNIIERNIVYSTKLIWNQNLVFAKFAENRFEIPCFLLNSEKDVFCTIILIQDHYDLDETFINCKLELKSELLLNSVNVIFNLNDGDDFSFNLTKHVSSSLLYVTSKKYAFKNELYCDNCVRYISLPDTIKKVKEVVVTYSILEDPEKTNLNLFRSLYNNRDYSDMTITIDNLTKFKAHKIVLATNSKVFKKMIDSDMKEKNTSNIDLTDIEISVFEEAFKFMYIGSCDVTKSPHEIFKFAHLFEIHYLQDECSRYLLNNIKFDNIIDTLKLIDVDAYDLQTLKVEVNKFIDKNENNLVLDNNYIKYHLDYMRPNNVHYLFCLAMRYNLHEVSEKVKSFIKQNIKDILKNKDFENLMYKNPEWAFLIIKYLAEN